MGCINQAKLNLICKIRLLWQQHSTWTISAIRSIVMRLPDEEYVVNRLLENPVDFAHALRPFYGEKDAHIFSNLLTEHLQQAAQLIKLVMAGDNKGAINMRKLWYKNADEISAFLASINPYWSEKKWQDMFYVHLGLVEGLAFNYLGEDYAMSIITADKLESEALEMADMMAIGIIKQKL